MSETAKPRLTLLAMLEAAHALRLAGALPAPAGLYVRPLVGAGGMRPWLRLALGDEAAHAMEAAGTASWHVGALLGTDPHSRHAPLVEFDPAEAHAIVAVDTLCEEDGAPRWSVWYALTSRIPAAAAEELLPALAASSFDKEARSLRTSEILGELLDGVAARFGLSPRKEECDLGQWGTREVDAVGERRTPREYYENSPGAVKQAEGLVVRLADGGEVWLHEDDPVRWPGLFGPGPNQRLRLTYHGVTSGHGGYLARVHDRDLLDGLRGFPEGRAVSAEITALLREADPLRAVDHEGREILKDQEVELLTECLEAPKGARGRVLETVGDMAIVNFGRWRAHRVPCYGHALSVAA